jgi:phytoene dehydrogenase-like protein
MNWDEEFDVVVIGSGIAGVATALAARRFGLKPVVIEKADRLGGGTAFSMGGIWIGMNHLMLAASASHTNCLTRLKFALARQIQYLPQDGDVLRSRSIFRYGPIASMGKSPGLSADGTQVYIDDSGTERPSCGA